MKKMLIPLYFFINFQQSEVSSDRLPVKKAQAEHWIVNLFGKISI